jgi:uncharacterized protein (DUF885 family)
MRPVLLISVLALAACGESTTPPAAEAPAAVAIPSPEARAKQLAAIYAEYWEENLKLNPLQATFIGDNRYNDQLPNSLTLEYEERELAFNQRFLDAALAIPTEGLQGQDLLSHEIFVRDRRMDIEGAQFPQRLMPINQFRNVGNLIVQLGAGTNAQPFKTVQDYDNWARRAGQFPVLVDQAIANMREGVAKGFVQPKVLMEKVLPQLDQQLAAKAEDSAFWGPVKNMPAEFSDADRQRLTIDYRALVEGQLVPAYRKLREFIATEYMAAARDTVGLGALPGGEAWYAYQVKANTTTDLTPAQIHQIGLDEVARIHGEMRKVMTEVGFKGELNGFFAAIKKDPKQYFSSEEDLLTSYRGFRATVEPLLPKLFDIQPRADFEIRPVEAFRAASASSGQYQRPPEDGSRPGIFYVNTYDLKARPRFAMESLYLHEATPGHHFQGALQIEQKSLPSFRRFGGETAFGEGWGLYSESLGKELGVFTDPYMYFGALDAELWRSIRLVTDTGIHSKGWTRQQVLDYMYANSPAEPTRAISEAERFMAIPGQALAYKIGQLRIRGLRTRAEKALGDRFDVRAFHTEVLKDGSLPLGILEARIDRWIAAQQPAPA